MFELRYVIYFTSFINYILKVYKTFHCLYRKIAISFKNSFFQKIKGGVEVVVFFYFPNETYSNILEIIKWLMSSLSDMKFTSHRIIVIFYYYINVFICFRFTRSWH